MAGVGGSPLAPRDASRPGRGPIAPSLGPRLHCRAPIGGPDRAPIAPAGPDQGAIALSLLALQPVAVRSARIRFWEGVVLLGISPELIFFMVLKGRREQTNPFGIWGVPLKQTHPKFEHARARHRWVCLKIGDLRWFPFGFPLSQPRKRRTTTNRET